MIVPRLFANQTQDEETAYNIAAAADTITVLCENAGDFMASRVEEIVAQLVRVFRDVRSQVKLSSTGHETADRRSRERASSLGLISRGTAGGTVDLHIVKPNPLNNDTALTATTSKPSFQRDLAYRFDSTRTSQSQILSSLISLLTSILSTVRLTLDRGDEIMGLLLPLMRHRQGLREVLEVYNADAVWLYDLRMESKAAAETADGVRGSGKGGQTVVLPTLRPALQERGVQLMEAVI